MKKHEPIQVLYLNQKAFAGEDAEVFHEPIQVLYLNHYSYFRHKAIFWHEPIQVLYLNCQEVSICQIDTT